MAKALPRQTNPPNPNTHKPLCHFAFIDGAPVVATILPRRARRLQLATDVANHEPSLRFSW
jgi:hypothetical protein